MTKPLDPDEKKRRRQMRRRNAFLADTVKRDLRVKTPAQLDWQRLGLLEQDFLVGLVAEMMWRVAAGPEFRTDVHYLDALQGHLLHLLTVPERFILRREGFLPLRIALFAYELTPRYVPTIAKHVEDTIVEKLVELGCVDDQIGGADAFFKHRPELDTCVRNTLLQLFRGELGDAMRTTRRYDVRLQHVQETDEVRVFLRCLLGAEFAEANERDGVPTTLRRPTDTDIEESAL